MIKNKMCVSVLSSFYLGDEDKRKLVLKDTKNIFSSNLYSYSLKDIKQKDITKDFLKIVQENKKSIFY